MLAGLKREFGQRVMIHGRRCDHDTSNLGIVQYGLAFCCDDGTRIRLAHPPLNDKIVVTDRLQNAQLAEIANEVFTPVPGTDNGNVTSCHGLFLQRSSIDTLNSVPELEEE